MKNDKQYLIIGYGFLGRNLATLLKNGLVFLASRSIDKPSTKENTNALLFDLDKEESWPVLNALPEDQQISVFFLLPPSQIDLNKLSLFVSFLKEKPLHKAILVSSTVVYGSKQRQVIAESEIQLDTDRAAKQFKIEQTWLELGTQAHIVRLAGLYGPGRIIGEKSLKDGKPIPSNPDAVLNLIHVEDAAHLLLAVEQSNNAGTIELGCDGMPVKRRDYYDGLVELLNSPKPIFLTNRESHGADRYCNNQSTMQRLEWQPKYKNYLVGLKQSLNIE